MWEILADLLKDVVRLGTEEIFLSRHVYVICIILDHLCYAGVEVHPMKYGSRISIGFLDEVFRGALCNS